MAKNQHNAGLHYRPLNQLGLSNFNDYIENPIDSRFKFNPPPLKCGKLFGLCKADRQKEKLQKHCPWHPLLKMKACRRKKPKKKPSTPMQTTPRTRAILRSLPMCRTRTKPRTSRTLNPSDFKAAFCRRTYPNENRLEGTLISILVVAEKPSVAMSYAKVLGATNRQDGYLEGNGYLVSWCVGHLVELAPPNIRIHSSMFLSYD